MRPTTLTVGPLVAAAANNIALSQTPSAAFTLNGSLVTGGVAVLDTPRRVLFTFAGADVGKIITVVGTSDGTIAQTEVITAVSSGTVYTALNFKTVTSIRTATALAAAVTVGTNDIASSRWMRLDDWIGEGAAIECVVTGAVDYSVQGTMQDPNSPTNPVAAYSLVWQDVDDTTLVNATTTQSGVIAVLPVYIRILLNAGSTGSVSSVVSQASSGGGGGSGSGGGSIVGFATAANQVLEIADLDAIKAAAESTAAVNTYPLPTTPVSGLTAAMTGTASTAVAGMGAPGPGLRNYIAGIIVGNSHATVGTFVELQDGNGGTTFFTLPAAAVYGGATFTPSTPIKQPTANTALYVKDTTTGANVIVSVVGFTAA